MSETIRVVTELTDEERKRLFGWGEHIFGLEDGKYTWRPKEIHIVLDVDGQAASHVGLIDHTVDVGGQPVRVGGVGGVATNGEMHGRGYARKTLRYAEQFMRDEMKVEFGLLFCLDRLKPFYERQGWQLLTEPVEIEQPAGRMVSPLNVMVLPFGARVWPKGATDLRSLPW
ncbi:MAG TPA: GNAT family N-acetyltransferase [Pyrinomonadaceae bacterium]|nr:GNAT family N-acetyltransferase [Pyrinomonadaceae bacterium]